MDEKDILKKEYYKNRTRIQRFVRSAEKRGYTFEENILPKIPKTITEGSVRRLEKITPNSLYRKSTYTYITPSGNSATYSGIQGRNIERKLASLKSKSEQEPEPFVEKIEKDEILEEQERDNREKELLREIEEAKRKLDELQTEKNDNREPHERFYDRSDLKEGHGNKADELEDGLATLRELIDSWAPSANWTESLRDAKEADKNVASNVLDAAIAEKGLKQVIRNVQANGDALKELLNHILYDSGSREGNFKDGRTQVNADIKRFQEILLGHTLSQQEAMKTQELIERLHHFEEV